MPSGHLARLSRALQSRTITLRSQRSVKNHDRPSTNSNSVKATPFLRQAGRKSKTKIYRTNPFLPWKQTSLPQKQTHFRPENTPQSMARGQSSSGPIAQLRSYLGGLWKASLINGRRPDRRSISACASQMPTASGRRKYMQSAGSHRRRPAPMPAFAPPGKPSLGGVHSHGA
jgi:hypothetical protein